MTLDAVLDAVVSALEDADMQAVKAFPQTPLDRAAGPLVCVSVRESRCRGSGFGDYLGLEAGDDGEAELYGRRLELTLGLDIYAPPESGAGGCAACFEALGAALPGLPAGLRPRALTCGETRPDPETGLLLCPAALECRAFLVARADPETGEFLDFILRGSIEHANE